VLSAPAPAPSAAGVRAVGILLTVLLTAGCSQPAQGETSRVDQLGFTFDRIGDPGYMDQTLRITNLGPPALVPTLDITPVDSAGVALPGVTVRTAYGSDQGKVLAPAQQISIDVLSFHGDRAADVADVRVTVRSVIEAPFPVAPDLVEAQALDEAGQPTSKFGPFDAVALTNPNDDAVSVGVVCILWDDPPSGQPQQALAVIPLGSAHIAAHDSTRIKATGEARYGCGSLKTYFSPQA
jgi:hypothetical protein